jgi:hypothetical protein
VIAFGNPVRQLWPLGLRRQRLRSYAPLGG